MLTAVLLTPRADKVGEGGNPHTGNWAWLTEMAHPPLLGASFPLQSKLDLGSL